MTSNTKYCNTCYYNDNGFCQSRDSNIYFVYPYNTCKHHKSNNTINNGSITKSK